jgi:two-component system, cell cycle sensor histidine kinase and response regulator CckA
MNVDPLITTFFLIVWGLVLIVLIFMYFKRLRSSKRTASIPSVETPAVSGTTGETELGQSNERLIYQAIEHLEMIVFAVNAQGVFTLFEGKGLGNIGLKKDDVLGKSIFEIYGSNKEILVNIRRALNGESFQIVVKQSGRFLHTHYNPVLENGRIVEVTGVAFDITDHFKAKEDLRESEERFQILAENIPGVIYLCKIDDPYIFIFVNKQIECITGYTAEAFERGEVTLAELIHPDDREGVQKNINEMLQANKPFEITYRLLDRSGKWRWVSEIGVGIYREGQPVMLEGVINDITDKRIIEDALTESEQKLRKIVEKSNDAIYIIHGKQFLMVNRKFEEIFGYSSDEVLASGFTFMNLLDEDSIPLIEERRRKRERGEQVTDTISFVGRTKQNKKIHLQASLASIEWEGKAAVLGILRDITIQKHLEDQLLHSQKIEAVGRLAGGLAHDFNNILTAISGYAELLSAKVSGDEKLMSNVQEIITASDRASKLVQQLLAFSRRQVLKPIPVNLNTIIQTMDSLLHRVVGEHVELKTYYDETLGTIEIDPALVEQVIMNLVINARDAMPEGGTLSIETFNTELSKDYGDTHSDVLPGRYVAFAVSDSGIGIAEDIRDQIYEPFFTTKEKGKGTGLGLSTVYGIVKQSGGHIWCYSEVARGTTFKIYFPRVDKAVRETKPEKITIGEVPRAKNETILIAEDEDAVRRFCSNVLSDLGYTILEAKDGTEAVRVSERHRDKIDLLVADIMMPGLNGRELADKLLKSRTELKVIFISGYTNNVIVNRGILEPGIAFIQKPFTPKILAVRVREVLDRTNGSP